MIPRPSRQDWSQFLIGNPWLLKVDLTFRLDIQSSEVAFDALRRFCNQMARRRFGRNWYRRKQFVRWAAAWELHKDGQLHLHVVLQPVENGLPVGLLGDCAQRVIDLHKERSHWWRGHGSSVIDKIESVEAVVNYMTKNVASGEEIQFSKD